MNSAVSWSRWPVPIEALQPGDLVLAVPDGDPLGTPQFMPITAIYHNQSTELLTVAFTDGSTISLTAAHEVFTATGGWGLAEDVRPGDVMLDKQGDLRIVDRVERAYAPVRTYNLTVAGSHTFFADGVWVHNCVTEFHHYLPKQYWGYFQDAKRSFSQAELDALGAHILKDWHKAIHGKYSTKAGAWNDRWRQFIQNNPNASRDDVLNHLADLMNDFGL